MLFHIFAEEASLKSFKFFIQKAFLILPAVQLLSRSSPTGSFQAPFPVSASLSVHLLSLVCP